MTKKHAEIGRSLPEVDTGSAQTTILVIGLGNPILGDDGVGWRISERVQARLIENQAQGLSQANLEVEFDNLAVGGLSLMERLIGYQRAIIIDAITTGQNPPGKVYLFSLDDLPNRSTGHLSSAHDASLQTALLVGRSMGAELPQEIAIVAVEAQIVYDFSEELTPPIEAAVSAAEETVINLLNEWAQEFTDQFKAEE